MIDLEQIKIIAQLLENMEILSDALEKAYNNNNAESFVMAKKEMNDIQNKISSMLK